MGAWGTGILENDLAVDTYAMFMEMYDEDHDIDDIQARLLDCSDAVTRSPDFWLGMAQARWECGCLDDRVLAEVERIVAATARPDADSWWRERRTVLRQFLRKIRTPCASPRPRTRRRVHPPIFEPGNCLAVRTLKGGFGGAIVLKVVMDRYDSYHLVAGLRGLHAEPPAMAVFEQRPWLYRFSHGNARNDLHIIWCAASRFEEDTKALPVTVVGETALQPTDPTAELHGMGVGHGGWQVIENQIWLQDDWAKRERSPDEANNARRIDLH